MGITRTRAFYEELIIPASAMFDSIELPTDWTFPMQNCFFAGIDDIVLAIFTHYQWLISQWNGEIQASGRAILSATC